MKKFYLKFWGVRGSIPVPGESTKKYGGNTSCIEICCDGKIIIFDAGTGIYNLSKEQKIDDVDVFLTHTHLDHIQGFPFFKPLYNPKAKVRVWAGNLKPERNLSDTIEQIIKPPIFPLNLKDLKAQVEFKDFIAGKIINLDDITIKTFLLNHPDSATAYRLEYKNKSICYVTDVEHKKDSVDMKLSEFIKDSDILIYDCTFTDEEYEKYKGWGHSTWQEGVKLANHANVKEFIIFHHNPDYDDNKLDEIAEKARKVRKNSVMAKEGLVINLS